MHVIRYTFFILLLIPLLSQSQVEGEMVKYLSISPVSLFDNTTEGISKEEIQDLVREGESATWKVSSMTTEKLVITCKYPFSQVTIAKIGDDRSIIVAFTENEQSKNLEIWERKEDVLQRTDLLPKVSAKEFFFTKNQFNGLSDYDSNVYFYLSANSSLVKAGLNTWMDAALKDKNPDFDISLKWNGDAFTIEKHPIMDR